MHITTVKLKDGRTLVGHVWTVRPAEGWFELAVGHDVICFRMEDCISVTTEGARLGVGKIGADDCLARWRREREEAEHAGG